MADTFVREENPLGEGGSLRTVARTRRTRMYFVYLLGETRGGIDICSIGYQATQNCPLGKV